MGTEIRETIFKIILLNNAKATEPLNMSPDFLHKKEPRYEAN